ncbi:MAG: hypothetical protein WBQ61_00840 [Candidatus Acidiferrum sp.]
MKLPHAEFPHFTPHVTPAAVSSPLTLAVSVAAAPAAKEVGESDILTEISEDVVIITETNADFVVSADDVAVMVTLFPVGTVAGAV